VTAIVDLCLPIGPDVLTWPGDGGPARAILFDD